MRRFGAAVIVGVVVVAVAVSIGFIIPDDEEEVTLDQCPAAVQATIQKYAAGGTIREIEKETKNGTTIYEAEIVKGGVEYELKVAANGAFLSMEQEGKDEDEGEKKISLSQAPLAVQATIRKVVGNNQLVEVEQESDDGIVEYEADYLVNGVKHSVACTASGQILEREQQVQANALPAAVLKALNKRFPGAAIKEAESVQLFFYEVELVKNGKEVEVKILADGRMGGDDDDDEDEDEKDDD